MNLIFDNSFALGQSKFLDRTLTLLTIESVPLIWKSIENEVDLILLLIEDTYLFGTARAPWFISEIKRPKGTALQSNRVI